MSPELKTLDELSCDNLDLAVVRGFFDGCDRFARAMTAMLDAAEVRLVVDGVEAPRWRWRELLTLADEPTGSTGVQLTITAAGIQRIG